MPAKLPSPEQIYTEFKSDRCEIYTSHWFWIEVFLDLVFGKIDITMATINRKRQIQ